MISIRRAPNSSLPSRACPCVHQHHRRRRSDYRKRSGHSRPRLAHVPSLLSAAENADASVDQYRGRSGRRLRPYLEQSVLPVLRANWYRLISKASGVTGGTVGDLILEPTALEHNSLAASFNQRHFALVPGLEVVEPR